MRVVRSQVVLDEVALTLSEGGQRLALVDGVEREVVVATARDLTEAGFGSTLSEGVFLLGTGSNGVCEAMVDEEGGRQRRGGAAQPAGGERAFRVTMR